MFEETVPVFIRSLNALTTQLDKAEAHCVETGTDPAKLLTARLAPDMWTFTQQVAAATDHSRRCMYRLTGTQPVPMDDCAPTFDALRGRIAASLEVIRATPRAAIDAGRDRMVPLPVDGKVTDTPGPDYLRHFLLPNFYFHCATAYAILRANGVGLSKPDYIGNL